MSQIRKQTWLSSIVGKTLFSEKLSSFDGTVDQTKTVLSFQCPSTCLSTLFAALQEIFQTIISRVGGMHQEDGSWHRPSTSGPKKADPTVAISSATLHLMLFLDESVQTWYYNHLTFSQNFGNKLVTWFSHPQSSINILFFFHFSEISRRLFFLKLDLSSRWEKNK